VVESLEKRKLVEEKKEEIFEITEEYKEEDFIRKPKINDLPIIQETPHRKINLQDFPEYKIFQKMQKEEEDEEASLFF